MFLSMTGANSHLPTLVYQNLSFASRRDGTTNEPSVDLSRTIQKTVSFASLAPSEVIRLAPTVREPIAESIETDVFYPDEEDGDDLTLFWEGLHHCQCLYQQIQEETQVHLSYSRAPLLDKLTVEDLLEWLYADVSHQLRDYLTFQEE